MLITRLGAVASQQPLPMIDAEHAASVGGLSMAANVDPTLSATYAASVDGLTFGASLDDHEIAMFVANVEGLTFAASAAPIVGVSHAANVGGLSMASSIDPIVDVSHAANVGGLVFGASVEEAAAEDADAAAYLNAVEAADGQTLESAVRAAVNDFVVGCKADGIWTPIKAACILTGARTLDGALVPLVGSAPTNTGFTSTHYNRKTGLDGGTGRILNSNRNNNADPQNDNHNAIFLTIEPNASTAGRLMGSGSDVTGGNTIRYTNTAGICNNRTSVFGSLSRPSSNYLFGTSRSSSSVFVIIRNGVTTNFSRTSETPNNANVTVMGIGTTYCTGRASFYSIGESLDLTLLDTRVSALMTALNSAIL